MNCSLSVFFHIYSHSSHHGDRGRSLNICIRKICIRRMRNYCCFSFSSNCLTSFNCQSMLMEQTQKKRRGSSAYQFNWRLQSENIKKEWSWTNTDIGLTKLFLFVFVRLSLSFKLYTYRYVHIRFESAGCQMPVALATICFMYKYRIL